MTREAEGELARGKTVPEMVRKHSVNEQTYYPWKRKYGGPRTDQAKWRLTVELGRDVVTECRACKGHRQARNTQYRKVWVADDHPQPEKWIVWMAREVFDTLLEAKVLIVR